MVMKLQMYIYVKTENMINIKSVFEMLKSV
jgi:hypothetical protein